MFKHTSRRGLKQKHITRSQTALQYWGVAYFILMSYNIVYSTKWLSLAPNRGVCIRERPERYTSLPKRMNKISNYWSVFNTGCSEWFEYGNFWNWLLCFNSTLLVVPFLHRLFFVLHFCWLSSLFLSPGSSLMSFSSHSFTPDDRSFLHLITTAHCRFHSFLGLWFHFNRPC